MIVDSIKMITLKGYVNQIIGVFKDAENEYNEVGLFTDIDWIYE